MSLRIGFDVGSDTVKTVVVRDNGDIQPLEILHVQGQPIRRVKEALEAILRSENAGEVFCGVTGAGASTLRDLIGAEAVHEPNALAAAIDKLYPEVRTIIEMGRESQKYLLFERDPVSGRLLVEDANLGNKCASGSGSFLDHMAKRLNYPSIEEFARVALEVESPASLSGRCAVFTESDIVHLYQKGTTRERISAGIHQAISRNYRSAIARGKEFRDKIAFIGGVSENPAVVKFLSEELELGGRLFVPEHNRTLGAIGAALRTGAKIDVADAIAKLELHLKKPLEYPGCEPIRLKEEGTGNREQGTGAAEENCRMMNAECRMKGPRPPSDSAFCILHSALDDSSAHHSPLDIERAALGVDIGSVSTKAALVTEIDGKFVVLASYYRRTDGDPLAAVRDTLANIQKQVKERGYNIGKVAAATTGSGRYLTGDYIGADLIRNEITAQASGALSYANDIDTIFEIGGQDSKYIRLDGDVIIDFEMNKACAAGTGAFLEKQALRLNVPLEEFGDTALKNTRPPDLDWTCTVFSESAMAYYQQNNVPVEDLAAGICLASVKNYLNKNVGSREIGGKIAFQGAVAFNKGMVAAYETVLGREVVVPPYPHITGAVGAARLAYLANPEQPSFRGFDRIADAGYEITSFECKSCANRCDVNTFQMDDGPKYFYNDRCEKFSAVHKKRLGDHLPDLFAERERMMMEAYGGGNREQALRPGSGQGTGNRVGIPRGLMFSEFFPLYNAFLSELGFEVVVSDPTNKKIVEMGLEVAIGEPCFPFKVAHGHYMDLIEKGVDIIFAPRIISTEQPNSNLRQAQTCPYLQAAPDVISSCVGVTERGIRHIAPALHFRRGRKHLERVFAQVGRELGKSAKESKRALGVGLEAMRELRRRVEARGAEILMNLPPDQMAFIVIGRPYTLWDPALNMDIGKKIQDLGILAIPQDFLPLESTDISDVWPNAYSRQIQKKLMAARLIRQDSRLRAVVLTYFACGPDSFGNPFFKDEIGEPCYVMQIDEHTADAGVITRIEAFADTAKKSALREFETIRSTDSEITGIKGRRLWIPYANESARILAEAMRAYGIDAEALPRSPDVGLNLGRRAISEDVCLPALMTTEDMLYRIQQPDFDRTKEAFFQGNSEGPCRFGMYSMLQRRILDKMGYADIDIVTLGSMSEHGGLGTMFALLVWDAIMCHDLLFKMVQRARPYEINRGESEALFERYLLKVIEMVPEHKLRVEANKLSVMTGTKHLDEFEELLRRAQEDFGRIPKRKEERPLVGVVGEFYVRLHDGANQDIVRKLESEGAETWLAPMTEFFAYANFIGKMLSSDRLKDGGISMDEIKEFTARWVNSKLAAKDEHALFHACLPFLDGYDDISSAEVIREGSKYVDYNFGGEAICSMGKSEDFARRGLAGIVSVIPFNCMPGNTVTALSQSLRRRHNNIPFLNLDYDGFIDSSRDSKIVNFMWQVKERYLGQKLAHAEVEGEMKSRV
ncbi:MAG: acyl-CoA dehydratase activase [Armatimonadetes bacterium]|nr:acyl-CoA dehydratase activase [Armatimonadota bacterium]